MCNGIADRRLHLVLGRDVAAQEAHALAGSHRGDRTRALRLVDVGERDACALGKQALDDRAADSPRAACHERAAVVEPEIHGQSGWPRAATVRSASCSASDEVSSPVSTRTI